MGKLVHKKAISVCQLGGGGWREGCALLNVHSSPRCGMEFEREEVSGNFFIKKGNYLICATFTKWFQPVALFLERGCICVAQRSRVKY